VAGRSCCAALRSPPSFLSHIDRAWVYASDHLVGLLQLRRYGVALVLTLAHEQLRVFAVDGVAGRLLRGRTSEAAAEAGPAVGVAAAGPTLPGLSMHVPMHGHHTCGSTWATSVRATATSPLALSFPCTKLNTRSGVRCCKQSFMACLCHQLFLPCHNINTKATTLQNLNIPTDTFRLTLPSHAPHAMLRHTQCGRTSLVCLSHRGSGRRRCGRPSLVCLSHRGSGRRRCGRSSLVCLSHQGSGRRRCGRSSLVCLSHWGSGRCRCGRPSLVCLSHRGSGRRRSGRPSLVCLFHRGSGRRRCGRSSLVCLSHRGSGRRRSGRLSLVCLSHQGSGRRRCGRPCHGAAGGGAQVEAEARHTVSAAHADAGVA
jgi:hypothetical protein